MGTRKISRELEAAEAELRAARRKLADQEARAAVAVADGRKPGDLSRFEGVVQKARVRARTLREGLGIARRREEREQEATKGEEQQKAREQLREQAHALAKLLDEALEAGRRLRVTGAKAAQIGAVAIGAGGASPEAENAIARWRDRLKTIGSTPPPTRSPTPQPH